MAHICIIEDDPAFAAALQRIMSQDHDVHTFPSVPDDAEQVISMKPDMIFLDCMLPGESGPHFLGRLRADERTRTVPIVLMSAYHEMMDEVKGTSPEFQEFLKKPCTIRQVMSVVQRFLGPAQVPTPAPAG